MILNETLLMFQDSSTLLGLLYTFSSCEFMPWNDQNTDWNPSHLLPSLFMLPMVMVNVITCWVNSRHMKQKDYPPLCTRSQIGC
jgi:hypothetical protein